MISLFQADAEDRLINMAPPPRYSTISDSHMSTSSQGAESTPSANSVLSESSLVLQTSDILPEGEDISGKSSSIEGIESAVSEKPASSVLMVSMSGDKADGLPASEAEWQARCIELELALQKFRDQAHNIRKLLRDKVSTNTSDDL